VGNIRKIKEAHGVSSKGSYNETVLGETLWIMKIAKKED